jgi:hypothetical protein
MTTLDDIKKAALQLSPEELARLQHWIEELQADAFDQQIERDALSGKLDWLADEGLADRAAGKTRKLR